MGRKRYILVELDEQDYKKLMKVCERMGTNNEQSVASMLLSYILSKCEK
ncbi:MAG: hypothetical protein QXZ63_07560 [Sulfolobales archaeon]